MEQGAQPKHHWCLAQSKCAATPGQPVSLHGYAPCQFCLRAWFKNHPLDSVSSNKASQKNEIETDCQPENSQHTTGCFILTIFRPHLTPPLPRVPTGVKAKRCSGSFRLACHFVPCHRQNFLFFFFAKTSSLEKCLLRLAQGRGQRCLLPPAPCSMFYVRQCKATGPPVFNSIPHRDFRMWGPFLPFFSFFYQRLLGKKWLCWGNKILSKHQG